MSVVIGVVRRNTKPEAKNPRLFSMNLPRV
jgi:hypothetical protein